MGGQAAAPAPGEPGSPPGLAIPRAAVVGLGRLPVEAPLVACGIELATSLGRELRRPVQPAALADWHAALGALPAADPGAERAYALDRAHADLEAALRAPSEVLVSLAREEERLERSVGREDRAAEAFVGVAGTVLEEIVPSWRESRERLRAHHRTVVARLEAEARRLAPNLAAVVGARTAARLVAAAGGLAPLARVSASRLQLLGSRRRPSADRGPRYGVIYLADGADAVPGERRAAYLRSVAALAAIAARADTWTHASIAAALVRRRDLRRAELLRRRR